MDVKQPELDSSAAERLGTLREVVHAWRAALQQGESGLRSHPDHGAVAHALFLAALEVASAGGSPAALERLAREHGLACGRLPGHSPAEVFSEFRWLRGRVRAHASTPESLRERLSAVLDTCCEHALDGFSAARTGAPEGDEVARRLAELDTIIEGAPEAIYIGTREGILRCNRPALEMLGFESMEQLRQEIPRLNDLVQNRDPDTGELIPPEELPFSEALAGKTSFRDTEVVHLQTQARKIVRGRAAPIWLGGEVIGAVAINSDITIERRREQELAEAIRLRDELLSMVSHELRSPLAALLLELQLAERARRREPASVGTSEAVTRGLSKATALAKRMAQMLDRLLDLSRIRSDRFGLELSAVDLCALVQELVARFQPDAAEAGSEISVSRCAPELFVYADPMRVEQVLTNLITNAIKYGAGKPIAVSLELLDDTAILAVRDHGIGISEADQRRIFDRYVRATQAHRRQSLGLGLYITREIILAHGGTIEVQSREGEGSTFTVRLPTRRMK